MISPETFQAIVSGKRQDLVGRMARGGFCLAEYPYRLATSLRNRRYDRDPSLAQRVDVPVISVGNLTLGGTGKTPVVAWLARWFRNQNVRVSLVSRGYGATREGRNDEAKELEAKLPDVPHLQNPDRVAAARVAIEELDTQLILLDDGYQHRRLARDLDIVLIDATNPFGYDHVFPRGLLRESVRGLSRAHVVALTRANLVDRATCNAIQERVLKLAPRATWVEITQRVAALRTASGDERSIDTLPDGPWLAFCGIGNPAAFRLTLLDRNLPLADFRVYPDHHSFDTHTMSDLARWVQSFPQASAVLCTHKDLVKVAVDRLATLPLFALMLELEIRLGETALIERLRTIAAQVPADEA
jgi:tetraacyldisaccharide 4'-kinase